MEFVVGPVVALLLAMKFNVYTNKKTEKHIQVLESKVELLENRAQAAETEMPKKILATISPVARAVKALNEQVGIQ